MDIINEITKLQSYLPRVPSTVNRSQRIIIKKKSLRTFVSHEYKHLAMTSGRGQHYFTLALMMEASVFITWKWDAEGQGKSGSCWNLAYASSDFYQQFYALQVVNKNGDIQTCTLHHNPLDLQIVVWGTPFHWEKQSHLLAALPSRPAICVFPTLKVSAVRRNDGGWQFRILKVQRLSNALNEQGLTNLGWRKSNKNPL